MTLLNVFSSGARARAADDRRDRGITLMVFALLGLVFAPMIGLHFAFAAVAPGSAPTAAAVTTSDAAPVKLPAR